MSLSENFSRPKVAKMGKENWRWTFKLPTSPGIFAGSSLQSHPVGTTPTARMAELETKKNWGALIAVTSTWILMADLFSDQQGCHAEETSQHCMGNDV